MSRVSHAASLAVALLAIVAYAGTAHADVVKCQKTIAKESSKFLQAKTKAMQKCYDATVKNGGGTCPNDKASGAIAKAASKLSAGIGKACGGDDKVCGGNLNNEPDQDAIFSEQCPDVERASCTNEMGVGCTGIAECLECMGEAAVDQAMDLYYGDLVLPSADSALNKCQKTIGKATSQFLMAKSKTLQKCWDKYLAGKNGTGDDALCTPPHPGDGKYLAALQKNEAKKIKAICKACGGADKACDGDIDAGLIVSGGALVTGSGGSDDLAPAAIGFATSCKDVTLPYEPSTQCSTLDDLDGAANVIDSLRELILCADCITEFKADCVDAAQVPTVVSYPTACNPCTAGAPTGPCPTTVQVTANGTDADLDTGWKGVAHNQIIPTNGRITLNVACAGSDFPTCGECTLSGPIVNADGAAFDNQRCSQSPWIKCSDDTPCLGACSGGTNAGEPCNVLGDCPDSSPGTACTGGTCEFFFGTPLPLSAGNVPVCVINQVVGSVSGTMNLADGTSATNIQLLSRVHVTGTVDQPCPRCTGGVCDSGGNAGQPCTVGGSNVFGPVSLDCPPSAAANSGNLKVVLGNTTGTETRTLSAANPMCRLTGWTGNHCFCDTCNNADADACSSDADCPDSPPGTPGICGGKRCLSGTALGNPCSNNSECPGGLCGHPGGQPTGSNECLPPDGDPDGCVPTANNPEEGECVDGPFEGHCSIEYYRQCLDDSGCTAVPNQTCVTAPRPCYLDNGLLGGQVSVTGTPDPACAGTYAAPSLGSLFCLAPTGSSAVNTSSGLPGLGRLRLPVKVIMNP